MVGSARCGDGGESALLHSHSFDPSDPNSVAATVAVAGLGLEDRARVERVKVEALRIAPDSGIDRLMYVASNFRHEECAGNLVVQRRQAGGMALGELEEMKRNSIGSSGPLVRHRLRVADQQAARRDAQL